MKKRKEERGIAKKCRHFASEGMYVRTRECVSLLLKVKAKCMLVSRAPEKLRVPVKAFIN